VAGVELLEEKQQVVNHSLEAIELGLGEAQVCGAAGALKPGREEDQR
jgi:kinesin light chain